MNDQRDAKSDLGLEQLRLRLREFADARDWNQFHSPKNLAVALSVEAGELLEHFQWLSDQQSSTLPPDKLSLVQTELADVLLYLISLADALNVDLLQVAHAKMEANAQKYPVDKARGNAKKYTEL